MASDEVDRDNRKLRVLALEELNKPPAVLMQQQAGQGANESMQGAANAGGGERMVKERKKVVLLDEKKQELGKNEANMQAGAKSDGGGLRNMSGDEGHSNNNFLAPISVINKEVPTSPPDSHSIAKMKEHTQSRPMIGNSSVNMTSAKTTQQTEKMQQLNFLKELYDSGYITVVEFKERKSQIIDELTGTTTTTASRTNTKNNARHRPQPRTVVPSPPPDWSLVREEAALKHVFDPETRQWSTSVVKVKLDSKPFAVGGLRECYHLQDLNSGDSDKYVAKLSIDPFEDREVYKVDVEVQMYSKQFAEKFNQYNPPNKVDFVIAWLLELIEREYRPLCGVERFIDGPYRKHNNNFGYVSEDERNTPQAFSHFTYEASNHKILICDIQGVGDLYTDPQMHTIDDDEMGLRCKGNMGARGINKFLSTHRCNAVCRYLRLPSINAKAFDAGTVPAATYMSYQKVDVVNVVIPSQSLHHFDQAAFLKGSDTHSPLIPVHETALRKSRNCNCNIL